MSAHRRTNTNVKRRIEIFSSGCSVCDDAVALVNQIACRSCEVEVLDMRKPEVAAKARRYGVKAVPAVVIDGKLVEAGVNETALRAAGVGTPIK